jgi:hypothetical protein
MYIGIGTCCISAVLAVTQSYNKFIRNKFVA